MFFRCAPFWRKNRGVYPFLAKPLLKILSEMGLNSQRLGFELSTAVSCSGDSRDSSISTPQAGNKKYQSVGTCSGVTRRGRRSRVPRKYLSEAFAACVVQLYLLCTDYYSRLHSSVLVAWNIAAFELHSCGCASPKRLKTTCCTIPRL